MKRKGMFWKSWAVVVAVAAGLVAAAPQAAHAEGLLDEIISRGKILVAIDLSSPPFGIQDANMEPGGYDVDVAQMLAQDLGVELEIVPVTSPNRIPYLLTKRVDLTISSFSITPERSKSVAFSNPYCALSSSVIARADSDIKDMQSLAGHSISVARGTTNESDLLKLAPPETNIVRFDDEASAQAALISGQVDAYFSGHAVVKSVAERNPDANLEIKFPVSYVYSGIAMRRDEHDLLRWVNVFVAIHRLNGDFARSYAKWFNGDLPELPVF